MTPDKLLAKFPIISEQITRSELRVILRELQKTLEKKVAGDVVELGCYEGTSALFEQRMLQSLAPQKELWLYDSFEGLPEKTNEDMSAAGVQFKAGELRAGRSQLIKNFAHARVLLPNIQKAWFEDLLPSDLPDQICFAFLDGDFHESIMDSLKLVWPKLQPGGVIIVDDYQNSALPGAAKAVDEWLKTHPAQLRAEASLAVIKPM